MRYRKLSPYSVDDQGNFVGGGDYMFGHGEGDFHIDVPEAPAQAVVTRLNLWEGQWFLDLSEGTQWKTRVLGRHTVDTRDQVIRFRTLDTMGVTKIAEYDSNLNRDSRAFKVNMTLDTVFGQIDTSVQGPL